MPEVTDLPAGVPGESPGVSDSRSAVVYAAYYSTYSGVTPDRPALIGQRFQEAAR